MSIQTVCADMDIVTWTIITNIGLSKNVKLQQV